MFEVLVISISNPLLVGIYKNKKLIKTYELDGKVSDVLDRTFFIILKNYEISSMYYVNTPGSYMSIKLSYVFLKTLSIVKNIQLYSCSGFLFNKNSPIKALGKKYFFNENDTIKVDFLEKDTKLHNFKLPSVLDKLMFSSNTLPIYNLPSV